MDKAHKIECDKNQYPYDESSAIGKGVKGISITTVHSWVYISLWKLIHQDQCNLRKYCDAPKTNEHKLLHGVAKILILTKWCFYHLHTRYYIIL